MISTPTLDLPAALFDSGASATEKAAAGREFAGRMEYLILVFGQEAAEDACMMALSKRVAREAVAKVLTRWLICGALTERIRKLEGLQQQEQ